MAVSNQTPANVASDYATIQFIVQQLMLGMGTTTLVRVQKCTNAGGLTRVGTVDVRILVDMQTLDGQTIPHGTIFQAPYLRMQGGTNAIILDPQEGDIGICAFASRDISAVKKDPDAARDRAPDPGAPPGSKRTFNLSDALYIGGMLNGVPEQYVQFNAQGITLKSPQKIVLEAPTIELKGDVAQTDGDVTMAQNLTVEGTVTGRQDCVSGTISGKGHTHPGVVSGPSNTGAPNG